MLELADVRVQYGGAVALDELSLKAPRGTVTGLIGPNGAGKTTAFNVCSGLVKPARGSVRFDGELLDRKDAAARARLGIGRTFQRVQLCDGISVEENLRFALESRLAGRSVLRQVVPRRGDREHIRVRIEWALELCGVIALKPLEVGLLSTGQRRLVELARCIAVGYRLLLLDEPSAGLDRYETAHFGELIEGLVAQSGIGVLLVEHDMSLVMAICSDIYVLSFGQVIHHGDPGSTRGSDVVQKAYLGEASS